MCRSPPRPGSRVAQAGDQRARYYKPSRPEAIEGTLSIDWVGKMVEAVSGRRLDRYFQEHIVDPLGIHDPPFRISTSRSRG